jgi:hypothetical protein
VAEYKGPERREKDNAGLRLSVRARLIAYERITEREQKRLDAEARKKEEEHPKPGAFDPFE